jgi:hypothetical protein
VFRDFTGRTKDSRADCVADYDSETKAEAENT